MNKKLSIVPSDGLVYNVSVGHIESSDQFEWFQGQRARSPLKTINSGQAKCLAERYAVSKK